MVAVIDRTVIAEASVLATRLKEEWDYKCSYHDFRRDTEVWQEFKSVWLESPIIQEILDCSEEVNREWKYWRTNNRIYDHIENLETIWIKFKDHWNFADENIHRVFYEMSFLSEGMLWEWRYMYDFRYPRVYGNEEKAKSILWEDFKKIWNIDINAYSEDNFNIMKSEMRLGEHFDGWDMFRKSKYPTFDALSVRDQYEIWKLFVNQSIQI
ncbi:hypothetical protein HDV06_004667 [Boothiomyces sp. JEL0866]|nr:hypothetical protein HDV06_004667 [Boothiomyces sp. JEL0866]